VIDDEEQSNHRIMLFTTVFWTSMSPAMEGSMLEMASITKHEERKEAPVPPYSLSISIPISPSYW